MVATLLFRSKKRPLLQSGFMALIVIQSVYLHQPTHVSAETLTTLPLLVEETLEEPDALITSEEVDVPKPATLNELKNQLQDFFLEENLGENAQFSCVISDARSGEFLLELNPRLPQTLTSLTKLYTAGAALEALDYDFRFRTTVAYSGELNPETGLLEGTVYLIGGGDPVLGDRLYPRADPFFPLNYFARELKAKGVKRITGNVVGVNSRYQGEVHALGWDDQKRANRQQTEVTALSFRDASFTIQVTPKGSVQKNPRVEVFPKISYINTENSAVITPPSSPLLPLFFRQNENNLLSISGQFPQSNETLVFQVPVYNPPLFSAHSFRQTLLAEGIRVIGDPTYSKEFNDSQLTGEFLEFFSPQLGELLPFSFKEDNSLIAESFGREVALKGSGEPTFQGASEAITRWAEKNGLRNRGFKLVDASGISPYNSASAESVAQLLYKMNGLSRNQRLFTQSLPSISPMREKFFGANSQNWRQRFGKYGTRLRFLTGDFDNTSAIAGYLETRQGRQLIIVLMIDKGKSPQITLDRLLDKIDLYFTD
ncbi:MAG: D-alanyl-D-alanine carboxypeptidase/D-alanyl-D-alanine-endopeptidase [Sumerlaeia bacterium]